MMSAKKGPSPSDLLCHARAVLVHASTAIQRLSETLGSPFLSAVELVHQCKAMVVVTGMGKSGLIASKISATLASTGTRSLFLHPAEAAHGDLGRIYFEDVVIALSRGGTTQEVLRLLQPIKRLNARLIAITAVPDSPLGRHADICLDIGNVTEACPLGLSPTTSTSVMLALGDALALSVMKLRDFSHEEFALFHPAGELGRKLLTVREVMRQGRFNPLVPSGSALPKALDAMTETRAGAVTIVDAQGRAIGFFTDGDLRRCLLTSQPALSIDRVKVDEWMTKNPCSIGPDQLASEAVHLMKERQFDQILVVDPNRHPLGLLDVQDLIEVGLV